MQRMSRPLSVLAATIVFLATIAAPALAETTSQGGEMSIAAVAAVAKPSVVGILTTMKANRSTDRGRAAGTGWVYKNGVILTNHHVVNNAAEVKILYPDKTVETVSPEKIFSDEKADIAVILVTKKNINPLAQGNSDSVTVGQTVIAVGNPLGFRLGNSVTAGILSGTGRSIGSGYPFLQMDAPINPGNSGGPLFNLKGEVIGVNSAKMADVGVEGLSFAIPINTAKQVADVLIRDGKVERATLGIALDEGWEAYFGVPNSEGVTISSIISDGPAGLTALQSRDKLIKLDETPVYTTDDVYAFLLAKKPGNVVKVTVKRGGQVLAVTVKLASQEELRKAAEEPGVEVSGILMDLTAGQIQEAAEFGQSLFNGRGDVNHEYFAVSGGDFAVLYTEYLFIARRVGSAYEFGFTPGVGFQQSVAKEINKRLEIQFQIQGDRANFLNGATYTLEQGAAKQAGLLHRDISYATSSDGSVSIAAGAVRFSTAGFTSAGDLTMTVKTAEKTVVFQFTIKDLR